MDERLQTYIARKLRNAIDSARSAASLHEGVYSAYEESLQWLEDLEPLPFGIQHVLKKYRGVAGRLPAGIRALHARKKVAGMSEADVRSLVQSLETAAQGLVKSPAGAAEAHPG